MAIWGQVLEGKEPTFVSNKGTPFPSDDKQLLLSISLADLDPTSKHTSDWKEEKSIAAIVAGSEETVRIQFSFGRMHCSYGVVGSILRVPIDLRFDSHQFII